jgi:hypothetical protein
VDSYTGSVFFCFRGCCFSLCFEACLVEFGAIAMEIDAHDQKTYICRVFSHVCDVGQTKESLDMCVFCGCSQM